jgi:hypothetical protein
VNTFALTGLPQIPRHAAIPAGPNSFGQQAARSVQKTSATKTRRSGFFQDHSNFLSVAIRAMVDHP